jgi:hypothetical protein
MSILEDYIMIIKAFSNEMAPRPSHLFFNPKLKFQRYKKGFSTREADSYCQNKHSKFKIQNSKFKIQNSSLFCFHILKTRHFSAVMGQKPPNKKPPVKSTRSYASKQKSPDQNASRSKSTQSNASSNMPLGQKALCH